MVFYHLFHRIGQDQRNLFPQILLYASHQTEHPAVLPKKITHIPQRGIQSDMLIIFLVRLYNKNQLVHSFIFEKDLLTNKKMASLVTQNFLTILRKKYSCGSLKHCSIHQKLIQESKEKSTKYKKIEFDSRC